MSEDPAIGVMFMGETLPKKPKVRLWDWVKYYAFNLYRKPMVLKRQKELKNILNKIKKDLETEVYPVLTSHPFCRECRDSYYALKPQVFLSQIEAILKRMPCEKHPEAFNLFLLDHGTYFKESERLSKWINNL